MRIDSIKRLNNGSKMPVLGLGTWEMSDLEAEESVLYALNELGYRHIDTASYYENEKGVGNGIRKSSVDREEIFVTTKIRNSEHDDPGKAFDQSLSRLGLDYVDLYLIHWPVKERVSTWKVLEEIVQGKKCRAIGVSNFTEDHLDELISEAEIVPSVNQVEFSPFLYQKDLLEFCKNLGIAVVGYSPLTRSRRLDNEVLIEIGEIYEKTPAQVMLRWALQKEVFPIPKSTNKEHLEENADVFDFTLTQREVKRIDSLNEGFRTCPDPTKVK